MADSNKVKFGLKNVHFAVATVSGSTVTYGTVKAIPGAVNLSLDASGDETNFAADDNAKYYNVTNNTGYSGSLELARVSNDFLSDVFGITTDDNGLHYEDAAVEPKQFALLFEFSGDANKTRHVLYLCSASRPSLASSTTTETKDPVTETLNITASPLPTDVNGMDIVRGYLAEGETGYSTFFNSVQQVSVTTV